MKIVLKILFLLVLTSSFFEVKACDIIFRVQGEVKEIYRVGDEIIVTVTVKLSHRVCNEKIEGVMFNFTGLKVLGATKWTELIPGEFQRKFKLQVTQEGKSNCTMSAARSCDKDGARGSISFKIR